MKDYKVGDSVWYANFSYQEIKIKCPACHGKLQIKVTLGNDEEFLVPCNGCDRGWMGSLGYIQESEWKKQVEQGIITKVDAEDTLEGRKIKSYYFNHTTYVCPEYNRLFDTKEEAEKRADELLEEHEFSKKESIKRKKELPLRTYGWHVRYHISQIKELEKKLEYHKTKLIICQKHDKKSVPENQIIK